MIRKKNPSGKTRTRSGKTGRKPVSGKKCVKKSATRTKSSIKAKGKTQVKKSIRSIKAGIKALEKAVA